MKEKAIMRLAWLLPRQLCYWCAIRVGAYATQGEYDDQSMLNVLFIEALVRWEERGIE